jgi:rhomboid protease GluP
MSEEFGTQPQPEEAPLQNEAIVAAAEMDKDQKFQEALVLTPDPILTIGLILINAAVFVLMAIAGVGIMDPSIDGLLRWGADYGPLTTHGQWWRLITSTFVHIGIMHVAMNMYILWSIGSFTERLFGKVGFLVLYLLAGIGGSLASLAWQPTLVSAGASGAVFGLYGGLLGYLLRQRHEIPAQRVTALAKNAGIFLLYNIVYGMAKSQVDMAAHAGGFVSGLVLGYVLATPLLNVDQAARLRKALITAVAGAAIAVIAATRLPAVDDFRAELAKFSPIESASLKLFNDSLDSLKKQSMTAEQFTEAIEKKLLPPWNAERDRLAKLRLQKKQEAFNKLLVQYMTLRSEGWSLMAKAAAANDVALVQSANAKQKQAEEVIKQINSLQP